MNKKWFVLVFVFLFGCSVKNPYQLQTSNVSVPSNNGVVIVSVKYGNYGPLNSGLLSTVTPTFYIRSKDDNIKFVIHNKSNTIKEFISMKGYGFIDSFELPANEYEIYAWGHNNFNGLSSKIEESNEIFSIPFSVEPGKINYLGQISLDNYVFHFSDERERDLKKIFKKYPFIKDFEVAYKELDCSPDCNTIPNTKSESYMPVYVPPPN